MRAGSAISPIGVVLLQDGAPCLVLSDLRPRGRRTALSAIRSWYEARMKVSLKFHESIESIAKMLDAFNTIQLIGYRE